MSRFGKIAPRQLNRAIDMRRHGASWRTIGAWVNTHHETVRRAILLECGGDPAYLPGGIWATPPPPLGDPLPMPSIGSNGPAVEPRAGELAQIAGIASNGQACPELAGPVEDMTGPQGPTMRGTACPRPEYTFRATADAQEPPWEGFTLSGAPEANLGPAEGIPADVAPGEGEG
jgi:hypothetical protein